MNVISTFANGFISLFTAGGATFMGWVTDIIPQVVCLMTAVNSVIKLIGEKTKWKISVKRLQEISFVDMFYCQY